MGYSQSYLESARRHRDAADTLDSVKDRRDVAGYLYGIAAECALKELMRRSGMRPLAESERREDPFYAHFPDLKTLLAAQVKGRHGGLLRKYAEDSAFMNEWDTDMRYAPRKDLPPHLVERWKMHARRVLADMDEAA